MSAITQAIHYRWLVTSDLPDLLEIDRRSFQQQDFCFDSAIRGDFAITRGAICGTKLAGYLIYLRTPDSLEIFRLAVHPEFRRQGIGRELMEHVQRKLSTTRPTATLDVPESMLDAQRWLRTLGVRCEEVIHSAACEEDWYRFVVRRNQNV